MLSGLTLDSGRHSAAGALLSSLLLCKVLVIEGNKRRQDEKQILAIVVIKGTALFPVPHKSHMVLENQSCTSDEFY